jgi:ferritin-like metal-binding protein YciE
MAKIYNDFAWILISDYDEYKEALFWAEKAVHVESSEPVFIDTLATVYQGLGQYDEALEQFKLCLKLQREQSASEERIQETEAKISALKELMKNGGVPEQ